MNKFLHIQKKSSDSIMTLCARQCELQRERGRETGMNDRGRREVKIMRDGDKQWRK